MWKNEPLESISIARACLWEINSRVPHVPGYTTLRDSIEDLYFSAHDNDEKDITYQSLILAWGQAEMYSGIMIGIKTLNEEDRNIIKQIPIILYKLVQKVGKELKDQTEWEIQKLHNLAKKPETCWDIM